MKKTSKILLTVIVVVLLGIGVSTFFKVNGSIGNDKIQLRLAHGQAAVRRYDGHESGCRHHHSSRWQRPVRGMLVGKATSGECDEKSGSVLCGNFHLTDAGHIHPCSERVAAYYAGPDVSPTVQMLVKPEQI